MSNSQSFYSVIRVCLLLAALLAALIINRATLATAFYANLGWMELQRAVSLDSDTTVVGAPAAEWFTAAVHQSDSETSRAGQELSTLFSSQTQSSALPDEWLRWSQTPRGHMHLWAVLPRLIKNADAAQESAQPDQAALWRTRAGNVNQAILEYESQHSERALTVKELLMRVALAEKVQRADQVSFWRNQLRLQYPSAEFAWLHNPSDPYALSALSEAYYQLGFVEDAIRLGERAIALHDWHWAHYTIAGYYAKQGLAADAERHLRAAVATAGADPVIERYELELANYYESQNKPTRALAAYCQIVLRPAASNASIYQRAVSQVMRLNSIAQDDVRSWCSAHSSH